jgi:hypothetical protein
MPRPQPEEEPRTPRGMPKTADYLHQFRGMWDREPAAVCWVRVFAEEGQTPAIVMSEHPQNPSTSVTNMAELLAAELIQKHFPERFDYNPPAILLEHYPGSTARGGESLGSQPGTGCHFTPGRRGACGLEDGNGWPSGSPIGRAYRSMKWSR